MLQNVKLKGQKKRMVFKKKHTIKTQIIEDAKSKKIYAIYQSKGSTHDFKLFKDTYVGLPNKIKIQTDSGYQGIKNIHANSETPQKASKLDKLTKEEKEKNRAISKERIYIEHVNGHIKRFKILSTRYRNKRKKHGLRMSLICGIYNYELSLA